jgi:hypothetical protein
MLKTDKPISRWRLAVAVLGWPCHMIIVQFYADLLREESRQPAVPLDDSWFHITLVFAIMRWGSVWAMAWMMTFGMSIFIQQVGWLGG